MAIRGEASVWDAETEGFELLEMTLGDLLDRQAQAFGEQDAVVYHYPENGLELRFDYRGLRERVNAVAKGLIALGVRAGDKVAVLATNVPEWLLLELAVPKIGAVLVTVNTNVRASCACACRAPTCCARPTARAACMPMGRAACCARSMRVLTAPGA